MACGRKRKYVDDASTSLEDLSPSTTPTLSTTPTPSTTPMQLPCLCRRLLSPLHPLRHDIANFHFRGSHDLYRTGYIAIHTVVYSSKAPVALKKPSGDPREQLELNVDQAATGITSIFHKRFVGDTVHGVKSLRRLKICGRESSSRAEEKDATTDTTVPNDLALMAIVAGDVSYGRVYGVGSEAAHLRAESSDLVEN
ncbi:hypothetical protein M9H77_25643 [Catharanthus roseus]|uniref:Uncharacterized protein n=1 Tax=Catharanthus roseus TaxID=4058 RepID=A0ACC0A8Y0_CATRO|nr:hypothetical protein M9H77_25643 [Catharanthus roseus]